MGFEYKVNEDIRLRLFESRHAEELFQLTWESRSSLREWLPWVDYIKEVKDSNVFIESSLKQFSQNNGFQAGIWYRGSLAGVIGLHEINWANKTTSIGYWLGTDYIGKGLMTKSCKAIIQYCFGELDLNRIEIRAATGNKKSQAIPERLGFLQEGCIRSGEFLYDRFVDHYVYGLLKSDSKSSK
ncbi:GNAT family N-acetyltransferase [Alkalihalobacillus pseudalcaliphilus]|uniref:GNAT family N-acetyltransferase n=1 Tax=Alkalihalobacillus pseudalcaliphilus TaxID=79884 RepID=UPI00064E11D9|nr:GNAT family protein [Alkalihalobacillus pseudalcaliphilus]KMK77533.1 alanine acetyltransferase [Alkalihalobacillus pseudalcaliphilus]